MADDTCRDTSASISRFGIVSTSDGAAPSITESPIARTRAAGDGSGGSGDDVAGTPVGDPVAGCVCRQCSWRSGLDGATGTAVGVTLPAAARTGVFCAVGVGLGAAVGVGVEGCDQETMCTAGTARYDGGAGGFAAATVSVRKSDARARRTRRGQRP